MAPSKGSARSSHFMAKKMKRRLSKAAGVFGIETARRESLSAKELRRKSENLEADLKRLEKTSQELHIEVGKAHGGAHLAHIQASKRRDAETQVIKKFPIVGIGASAGGLEAVTQLLTHLPANTDMAFVLVQHLDPTHESALSSLLA